MTHLNKSETPGLNMDEVYLYSAWSNHRIKNCLWSHERQNIHCAMRACDRSAAAAVNMSAVLLTCSVACKVMELEAALLKVATFIEQNKGVSRQNSESILYDWRMNNRV